MVGGSQRRGRVPSAPKAKPRLSRKELNARAKRYASRYSGENYEEIAAALETLPSRVEQQARCFEAAARWYFLDQRSPKRARPTDIGKQLLQIRDAADRLLAHLGINVEDASEGPDDPYIFDALIVAMPSGTEDDVTSATVRIAKLAEIMDAICATLELRNRAHQGADDVAFMGRTVPKGYQGDWPLNCWTLQMLSIHRQLTGDRAGWPLGRGKGARLYSFLAAAGQPLGIEQTPPQWKDRVKTIIRQLTKTTSAPH